MKNYVKRFGSWENSSRINESYNAVKQTMNHFGDAIKALNVLAENLRDLTIDGIEDSAIYSYADQIEGLKTELENISADFRNQDNLWDTDSEEYRRGTEEMWNKMQRTQDEWQRNYEEQLKRKG